MEGAQSVTELETDYIKAQMKIKQLVFICFLSLIIECCLCFMLFNDWMDKRALQSKILEQQQTIEMYEKVTKAQKIGE